MADKFDKATKIVQDLPEDGPVQVELKDKLKFYGLYKQATVGVVNTARPSMFNPAGRAKWDAWNEEKDKTADECKKEYVDELIKILKANESEESKKILAELE